MPICGNTVRDRPASYRARKPSLDARAEGARPPMQTEVGGNATTGPSHEAEGQGEAKREGERTAKQADGVHVIGIHRIKVPTPHQLISAHFRAR